MCPWPIVFERTGRSRNKMQTIFNVLTGSDLIKALKKGGPAPHHLTMKMFTLPHEP